MSPFALTPLALILIGLLVAIPRFGLLIYDLLYDLSMPMPTVSRVARFVALLASILLTVVLFAAATGLSFVIYHSLTSRSLS